MASLTPSNPAPPDYVPPAWPGLYWPLPLHGGQATYLYSSSAIYRFTVLWTLVLFGAAHLACAGYALAAQRQHWRVVWAVPVVYAVVGGMEAFVAGSVVGGLLGGVYTAGYFEMTTWMPFFWALISVLVLVLSSFAIQGGL